MNNFIPAIIGFYTNGLYYEDTDSINIENKLWDELDKAGLVGKILLQEKTIIKTVVIFMDCSQLQK